jgi:hypothetical protein
VSTEKVARADRPWAHLPELSAWLLFAAALQRAYVFLSETLHAREDLWFLFSSDTVQYGLLYRDLFDDGFHFAGWNISHAPEYVQMVWALLLRAIAGSLTRGHVLEAMLQPVLLALALRFVLARLGAGHKALAPLIASLVLVLIGSGNGSNLIAFVWSNRHGFTVILSLLALGFLIDALDRGRWAGLVVTVASGMASDLLFVVWFIAPAIATLLILYPTLGRDRVGRIAMSIGAGALAGWVAFWVLTPVATVGSKVRIQPELMWGALNRMADVAFKSSSLELGYALVCGLALFLAFLGFLRSSGLASRVLCLHLVFLGLATIVAVAGTAAPFREGSGYTRYLLAFEFGALTMVVMSVRHAVGNRGAPFLLIAAAVAVVPGFRRLPPDVPGAEDFYPPFVRCLDEVAQKHRLRYGVADYWISKYVSALSRSDLRVVSVTPRLDPFADFTNIEWFLGGVGARRHEYPEYTFAVLGSMRPTGPGVSEVALTALGAPRAVETCSGFEIRVLPAGADEKIREQFRSNPRIREYYKRNGYRLPDDGPR